MKQMEPAVQLLWILPGFRQPSLQQSFRLNHSYCWTSKISSFYFCLPLPSQSFKESATPDPLCASVADKACSSRNREGGSQFEQKQFSWLPVQQGKLEVCGSWYKTGGSPGNPPTYVFVDCKELSRMDRLSSSSEMLSSLSPATPSTLRDNWSFLRRMSTECSFLSQRFIASLDTTVFSKATMINWTAGERKKEKRAVSRKIPSYAYPVPGWAQCALHYKYFAKPPEN